MLIAPQFVRPAFVHYKLMSLEMNKKTASVYLILVALLLNPFKST